MRYLETYQQALAYIKNAGIKGVKPEKREVWIYPQHEMVWSVKDPTEPSGFALKTTRGG